MYERKTKAIPNRTIGLQRAIITDSFKEEACKVCDGSGTYKVDIPSVTIKNLKNRLAAVCVMNECQCEGGVIRTKMRVIRRNNISAII